MKVIDIRLQGQGPGGCSRTSGCSAVPEQKIAKIGGNIMISWM
jgi:hypothetical protein